MRNKIRTSAPNLFLFIVLICILTKIAHICDFHIFLQLVLHQMSQGQPGESRGGDLVTALHRAGERGRENEEENEEENDHDEMDEDEDEEYWEDVEGDDEDEVEEEEEGVVVEGVSVCLSVAIMDT